MDPRLSENRQSLLRLVAPPLLWAAHLLLSYCTAAIYCEKIAADAGSLGWARVAIAAYTVIVLASLTWMSVAAYRRHTHGDASLPHDFDSPEDRDRFLGFATLLLAAISMVAVIYQALAAGLHRDVRMRRPGWFALGVLALAVSWGGVFEWLVPGGFSAHMAMHMGVVAVAAPLLALGMAGGRLDPVRLSPGLFAPLTASVAELIAVWAFHAPALHHFARHTVVGVILEQGVFLTTGFWVWMAALGGEHEDRGTRAGQGCLALVLTSMHMTLLGALLALPPRALYSFHAHAAHSVGLDPIADQHLGGAIMLTVGGLVYLIGGLALVVEMIARTREHTTRA